jgi:molybdopterin converting factor small subunit
MAITVDLPGQLRPHAGGQSRLSVEADSVAALLDALAREHPALKDRLLDSNGAIRQYVRVFVNEEDVRFLDEGATPLRPGDTVSIVPAIAGG